MTATGLILLLVGVVIGIFVGFFLRDRQSTARDTRQPQLPTAEQLATAMDGISSRLHALDVSRAETSARLNQEMQHLTQTSLALAGKRTSSSPRSVVPAFAANGARCNCNA